MKFPLMFFCGFTFSAFADIVPATFDLAEIRDISTLETRIIQDWQPMTKVPGVKQKLIEITLCEWWPEQKVRVPVTFCAPDLDKPCENILVTNMGLALKPASPAGADLKLLTDYGVGIVMVGMGTIDAMEPKGTLHLGMKDRLLRTKEARFTPAWIWGMSDMRALTAAVAEDTVFRPKKVLATGGSKRGVGAAICGIYDDRFTAMMPVVAPILGNPGGAYVRSSALHEERAQNEVFLSNLPKELPATAKEALEKREQTRLDQSITIEQALVAGWTEAEMLRMNDEAWNPCRIAKHFDSVKQRGLDFFYHVGSNDNVCPALRQLGESQPDFPLYILPGGQHGGPKSSGYTLQTPTQPEASENLLAFARHHFFNHRSLPYPPKLELEVKGSKLHVSVTLAKGSLPQHSELSWSINRHSPYTFAFEYDLWKSMPLNAISEHTLSGEIEIPSDAKTIDVISTHKHEENHIPFHFSSPYRRWVR